MLPGGFTFEVALVGMPVKGHADRPCSDFFFGGAGAGAGNGLLPWWAMVGLCRCTGCAVALLAGFEVQAPLAHMGLCWYGKFHPHWGGGSGRIPPGCGADLQWMDRWNDGPMGQWMDQWVNGSTA